MVSLTQSKSLDQNSLDLGFFHNDDTIRPFNEKLQDDLE
jgi:hypothetical protein